MEEDKDFERVVLFMTAIAIIACVMMMFNS